MSNVPSAPSRRVRVGALLAAAWMAFSSGAVAQGSAANRTTGRWRPVENGWIPETVGPSQRAAGLAQVDRLIAILRRDPALAPPVGFDLATRRIVQGGGVPGVARGPLDMGVSAILFFYFDDEAGRVEPASEGPGFAVGSNRLDCMVDLVRAVDEDSAGPIVLEPQVVDSVHGFPRYESGCVVLTHITRPMWMPVTQEEWLRLQVAEMRGRVAEARGTMEHTAPGAQLAEWLRGRPERQQAHRQVYEMMKARDAAQAERYRAQADSMERAMEQAYRRMAGDAQLQSMTRAADDTLAALLRGLEAELAALTPAQRRGAAYWSAESTRRSHLVDEAPARQRLVRPNPDYFDRAAPRSAFQLIGVAIDYATGARFHTDFGAATYARIADGLDWRALEALLAPPATRQAPRRTTHPRTTDR